MKKQSLRFYHFNIMSYAREHGISEEEVRKGIKLVAKDFNPKQKRMMFELHVLGYLESKVVEEIGWKKFAADVKRRAREFS